MPIQIRCQRPLRSSALCLAAGVALATGCQHSRAPAAEGPTVSEDVNVGYGTRRADNVTGAVASVTAEELERTQFATMESALRGRVPGLQVIRRGQELSLRIRGMESGRGLSEPHVVIDGAAASARDLLGLSPEVIARIDILKDASAAVYGFRGANGVILVTTKRGR